MRPMDERWVFLFDGTVRPWHDVDLPAIRRGLEKAASLGVGVEELDTRHMPEEMLSSWRADASFAAMRTHHAIRQVFGSRNLGGLPYFGKQVPALLVFDEDGSPRDVYPHRTRNNPQEQIESWIVARIGRG